MAGTLDAIQLDTTAPIETAQTSFHQQEKVLNYVHTQLGIPSPGRPTHAIEAPNDVTHLTDDQLGNYLFYLGQWVGYIDYQLSHVSTQRESAEAYLTFIQARVRLAIKSLGKKPTNQDKSDIMETNPQVVAAKEAFMFWDSTYELTRSLKNSVQLSWDTVSRRITQRGQEVDRMRRESNVAGVPAVTRTFRRPGQTA